MERVLPIFFLFAFLRFRTLPTNTRNSSNARVASRRQLGSPAAEGSTRAKLGEHLWRGKW